MDRTKIPASGEDVGIFVIVCTKRIELSFDYRVVSEGQRVRGTFYQRLHRHREEVL